jgi:hypothetical protein
MFMKHLIPLSIIVLVVLITVATGATRTQARAGEPSLVWWLDNPAQVSGAEVPDAYSTLQRGYFSVNLSLHTSGLTPGNAYSLWWVIFQNPGLCVAGCGDDEINSAAATGVNPVGIGVHFGGAFTAAESGKADIGGRLLEDTVDACAKTAPYAALCVPLRDASTAEVLVFLVDHGPVKSGAGPVTAFDAGCRSLVWFGYVVAQYNKGDFACYRAQSTYHRP